MGSGMVQDRAIPKSGHGNNLCAVCSHIFTSSCVTTSLNTGQWQVWTQIMLRQLQKCLPQSCSLMMLPGIEAH